MSRAVDPLYVAEIVFNSIFVALEVSLFLISWQRRREMPAKRGVFITTGLGILPFIVRGMDPAGVFFPATRPFGQVLMQFPIHDSITFSILESAVLAIFVQINTLLALRHDFSRKSTLQWIGRSLFIAAVLSHVVVLVLDFIIISQAARGHEPNLVLYAIVSAIFVVMCLLIALSMAAVFILLKKSSEKYLQPRATKPSPLSIAQLAAAPVDPIKQTINDQRLERSLRFLKRLTVGGVSVCCLSIAAALLGLASTLQSGRYYLPDPSSYQLSSRLLLFAQALAVRSLFKSAREISNSYIPPCFIVSQMAVCIYFLMPNKL